MNHLLLFLYWIILVYYINMLLKQNSPVPNFSPTTLLLFYTHSRPHKLAFSYSFMPILHFIWLYSHCPLEIAFVKYTSDFHGANSMASSLFLPHLTSLASNTDDIPSFLKHLPFLIFYSPRFLSRRSLATSSQCHYLTPSSHPSLNSRLSLVLVWTEYCFFSLPQCFLVRVLWPFWARQFFVLWDVLCIEGLSASLVSRHLIPILSSGFS